MRKVDVENILKAVDQDKGLAISLIQLFIENIPLDYQQLKLHSDKSDFETVSKIAHKMKSGIATMGLKELAELVHSIEISGRNKTDLNSVPSRIESIGNELDKVYSEMKELVTTTLQ